MKMLVCAIAMMGSLLGCNEWVSEYLTETPDFPKPGILFYSYEKMMRDPDAFQRVIETFAERYRTQEIDAIVGLDSRGFIFGAALAHKLHLPFVIVRKAGKLPGTVEGISYGLEYGKSAFEIQLGTIKEGEKVVIIDDLLATGGTAEAASLLVERLGGTVVETAFFIELADLNGRAKVGRPVYSFLQK